MELLWKVLAPNRMALVRALTGAGVASIREAARRVNRDVRAVHSDVTLLINAGLLNRAEDGIEFPYEAVHVDFILKVKYTDEFKAWLFGLKDGLTHRRLARRLEKAQNGKLAATIEE